MKNRNLIRGQSMFEITMAIFIMALIIVGVVILATNSIANSTVSKNKTVAGRYTQEAIEWLRRQRDVGMTEFKSRVPQSLYCLDTLSDLTWNNTNACGVTESISGTIFTRELTLTQDASSGNNVIEARVVVYWSDVRGKHEAEAYTNFTDTREN